MAKKKKGKKKKGVPDGTLLEDHDTVVMKLKELQKYAVKLGATLNETKREKRNLEIDRDKMVRNIVNVVNQCNMIKSEIKRLDQELINKENIFEMTMLQKINELAELRFRQTPQFYKSKNDLFVNGYEGLKKLFVKQDQLFKDRFGLNSDYYKRYLELEGTFMTAKHNSLCAKMDKLNETNIAQMLWTERNYKVNQQNSLAETNAEFAKEMKWIVDTKEALIDNIQKEHVLECVDILRSYENITKYNFTLINELSKELAEMRHRDLNLTGKLKQLQKEYGLYSEWSKECKKKIWMIDRRLTNLHHYREADKATAAKLSLSEEKTTTAWLEVEWLEECIRSDEEVSKKLKNTVISELMAFRQMQIRAHLFMSNAEEKIREMFEERVRVGKLALCPKVVHFQPFLDFYHRYNCYRKSLIDIVDRILRSDFSNINTLGFHQESPAKVGALLPPTRAAPKEKMRQMQAEIPSYRMPPPVSKFNCFITSLPRVPLRRSADHLLPHMTINRKHIVRNAVKMPPI